MDVFVYFYIRQWSDYWSLGIDGVFGWIAHCFSVIFKIWYSSIAMGDEWMPVLLFR